MASKDRKNRPGSGRNPSNWCPRCQERDSSPDPQLSLLNPQYETFCRNLAIGKMTKSNAYMAAGFTTKNQTVASKQASRLMCRIEVSNRLEALLSATIELDAKTREWVDNQLKKIVERCMQAKPHMGANGKPDGQWTFDAGNANKALFSMGKDRGMFGDKLELTRPEDAALHGKSAKEVREMVAAAAIDLGRDFIKQLGETVGLQYEGDGEALPGATSAPGGPVPSLH